jgi:hypothetical protein
MNLQTKTEGAWIFISQDVDARLPDLLRHEIRDREWFDLSIGTFSKRLEELVIFLKSQEIN